MMTDYRLGYHSSTLNLERVGSQHLHQHPGQGQHFGDEISLGNDSIFEAVFIELTELISSRELYKQPRLSVKEISDLTGLSIKDISNAFSEGGGMNFNRYINLKRIEAVQKSLAASTQSRSFLEIAFASGFNSKSSFNSVFRKEVGETPSQYVKRYMVQTRHAQKRVEN